MLALSRPLRPNIDGSGGPRSRSSPIGKLGGAVTVIVEDDVQLQLLDGSVYKDISDLSTGQRCTVVLPIILGTRIGCLSWTSRKTISITLLLPTL